MIWMLAVSALATMIIILFTAVFIIKKSFRRMQLGLIHSLLFLILTVYGVLVYISLEEGTTLLEEGQKMISKATLLASSYISPSLGSEKDFVDRHLSAVTIHLNQRKEAKGIDGLHYDQEVQIEAPFISQLPELPRGCEVTSLAMLLQFAGLEVDKMTLAEEIKKDPTPYARKNGQVYFGDPHQGFVGNMYTKREPGYGVYHQPINDLAETYLPQNILNLTGKDFTHIQHHLSKGMPVWTIVNVTFAKLPASSFETWETPNGRVDITYRLHSVLVTGYDQKYVYFNDPLQSTAGSKAPLDDFIEAWEQLGSQAITLKK